MTLETLLASSGFALVTALVYAYVGRIVARRRVATEAQLAVTMFAAWWYGLAGLSVVTALFTAAAALGLTNLEIHVALLYLALLALGLMLWALGYYLLYLFVGASRTLWPLGAFYVAYFLLLVYLVESANPIGVTVGDWGTTFEYEHESFGGPVVRALLLLLLLPQIVGAVAYFTLLFKTDDPLQRYRIGLVAGTIIVWFGASILASLLGINDTEAWQIVSRLNGLAAALLILAAYRPPAWVRGRLQRAPVEAMS